MPAELAGWLVALALVGALIPTAAPTRRGAATAAFALLLLYGVTFGAAAALAAPSWQLLAPLLAAAAVWLVVQPLVALGRMTRSELGLVAPRPGTLGPSLLATLLLLTINVAVMQARGAAPMGAWVLLPLAIVAAVIEELVFRGVLLALVDRAHPPDWTIAGARIGIGGLVLTLAFMALHGLRPGVLLGVAPAALLYLWLRARSGSLLPPMAAHATWNALVVLLHR